MTTERDFMTDAKCRGYDPEQFFPHRGEPATKAKQICLGTKDKQPCPVIKQCLDYAVNLGENPYGIWGGTTPKQRLKLRAELRNQTPEKEKPQTRSARTIELKALESVPVIDTDRKRVDLYNLLQLVHQVHKQ